MSRPLQVPLVPETLLKMESEALDLLKLCQTLTERLDRTLSQVPD